MANPEISIAVPTYNSAWSIGDTIRSVLAQQFADFELIIVDDGSTDDLENSLRAFEGEPRLRLVRQANAGLAGARNRGLAEARATLVAFLDADDIWHPAFLKRTRDALLANKAAPFAYAYSFRIDRQNRLLSTPGWTTPPRHDFEGLLAVNSVGNGSASLFRRTALESVGGFDSSLRDRGAQGAEDWKLCLQLAAVAPPVLVPEPLVGYRLLPESMSQSDPVRQLRAVRTVLADIRKTGPTASEGAFRDARTTLNGWLLPAVLRKGEVKLAARLLTESYLLNPLWFRSRELRSLHWQKLKAALHSGNGPVALADLTEPDGGQPYSFLSPVGAAS
ncbi:glycosyltransferase family 2 protein [Tabrizicola sp. J26]|uniref:glycosyltransferase family 2 protein n=1 Tax=Alitabrizicola rongguiensis TaxID=2909234 RepID=UPI001F2D1E4D|nr:glycosyltransferase family A protein [Tabrizicola rongguiensis]MCF1707515.1 glycosyltransferase family 2 protein [Tabrizicola rongguiensis]